MKSILFSILLVMNTYAYDAFISASELKNNLDNPKLVLLDINSQEDYDKSHIKNALHVDITRYISTQKNIQTILSNIWTQRKLRQLGIQKDSDVVIYARSKEQLNASYFAMILILSGFENVSILDGGYMTWTFKYNRLVSSEESSAKSDESYEININKNLLVNTKYVKETLNNTQLIDSRDTPYYFGTKKLLSYKLFGHIPSAKSSFYKDKFLSDFTLRDDNDIEAIFISGLELNQEQDIIVYGDSVFDASMNWFIIYKKLGFKNAKIYEGSFKKWDEENLKTTSFKWE
jgi:thiosulfate/3-mercaptopyruvate sulfurtransferase